MQTAHRFSKQRETILKEIRAVKAHPTAEDAYEMVKKKIPNVSLGTVYRNLGTMREEGELVTFSFGKKEHFDGNTRPHIHLCCERCMQIEDVFFDKDEFANSFLNNQFDLNNVVVTGICKKCKEKENEKV